MSVKRAAVLYSGPGAGKGSDARVFEKEGRFSGRFEMGPHLLKLRETDSALHREMKRTTDRGLNVSDKFMLPILNTLLGGQLDDRLIVDGVTRTPRQAEVVLRALHRRGYSIVTIHYHIPLGRDDIFHERMVARNRAGETEEVREARIRTFRKDDPGIRKVLEASTFHTYHSINAMLEFEERRIPMRAIFDQVWGPHTPPQPQVEVLHIPPAMVCSDL